MRIPLNWLGEFVKLPKKTSELTDKLTMVGHMLDKLDTINGHTIIDLELRGNRADCYSIIGIARETAALFDSKIKPSITNIKLKRSKKLNNINLSIETDLVKRVMMIPLTNIKIDKSPKWLKDRLSEYGMESINNIVDLTNYVMIETGQPMHAFDLDKIGTELEIRLAKKGEQMITFQGRGVTLDQSDLVWANKNNVLSVAGAIGGKEYSISASTKNILLEAASYDRTNIRRSIHKQNLFTEAGIRHEKELDPNLVEVGVLRFLELMEKNKWGKFSKIVFDYYPKPVKQWSLVLNYDYLRKLSGINIENKVVVKILKALNFDILKETNEFIEVLVPTYRTDVTLEEDIIEEIIRIYGYDKIPTQTLSLEIPKEITPDFITQELKIKNTMNSLGFDEVISSSFVKEKGLKFNTSIDGNNYLPVKLLNRPSPDYEVLRMSLYPNLKDFTQKIFDERGNKSLLFEVGKIYLKDKKDYIEKRKLGIIYAQDKNVEFTYFKGYIEALFEQLNISNLKFDEDNDGYVLKLGKEKIGYGFEKNGVFYAEIDLDNILNNEGKPRVQLWPKYPPQIEDITIELSGKVKVGDIVDVIRSSKSVSEVELIDTYKNSYTFRIWYQDASKTLKDKEVSKIRNGFLKIIREKMGGVVKS